MNDKSIDASQLKALRRLIEQSNDIVVTCHLSPDGDALGSSLALARVLSNIGKNAKVITPDQPPHVLMSLPGARDVVVLSRYEPFVESLLRKAQLVFCLDYNQLARVDRLARYIASSPAAKVMIDHHLGPDDFGQEVTISRPAYSSTCELLFQVLCGLGLFKTIDKAAAECIYTGMMTDTGNFTYNSNDPEIYTIIADLLDKGIDKDAIYQSICNVHSANSLMLNGYALSSKMEVFPDAHAALICITREELNRFSYKRGDTEGLVNVPLSIPGIVYSCYLRDEEDYVKVSMRSKGSFPVNTLCTEHFGGGGHLNAAGGEFHGTMEECAELFRSLLETNKEKYLSTLTSE